MPRQADRPRLKGHARQLGKLIFCGPEGTKYIIGSTQEQHGFSQSSILVCLLPQRNYVSQKKSASGKLLRIAIKQVKVFLPDFTSKSTGETIGSLSCCARASSGFAASCRLIFLLLFESFAGLCGAPSPAASPAKEAQLLLDRYIGTRQTSLCSGLITIKILVRIMFHIVHWQLAFLQVRTLPVGQVLSQNLCDSTE